MHHMRNPEIQGKRYANWARRSDEVQAMSIEDQIKANNQFARDHGMQHVHDFILDETGSMPGARKDIPEVIETCVREKVEVLLLHDTTRLTRSGAKHGMKVLYEIESRDIKVVFVRDDIPGGEFGDVYQSILFFAGQ